ncbi:MAG: exopolyphosphatase [Epsilonproteobacteria bacterium]|nr:exopolyphosphatase [Campylobacterota bacterium]
MEIITIDLGSNSLRVLKYDCTSCEALGEFEKTVGTADGLAESGNISDEAINRIINAINESIEKLNYDPLRVIAVTTQALRVAKNNFDVLEKIKVATRITFKIIDGEKEANLTLLAIMYALKKEKLQNDEFLLLDIGGGSTELVVVSKEEQIVKSFPFGIVTLTQSKDQEDDFLNLKNEVEEFLKKGKVDIKDFLFISTAGTPTTICAVSLGMDYETYDKTKVNGKKLYFSDVCKIQQEFKNLNEDELKQKVGTGRTSYINMGVEIFKLFFKILDKEYSVVFDDGLREGIAIEFCLKNSCQKQNTELKEFGSEYYLEKNGNIC